jgi:hypothetical protein
MMRISIIIFLLISPHSSTHVVDTSRWTSYITHHLPPTYSSTESNRSVSVTSADGTTCAD